MMLRMILLALVGCSRGVPVEPSRGFSSTDDQAVRGVLLAQRDAWNRGDLDGYMAGYWKDQRLLFTAGGVIRRGWAETDAKYRAKYGTNTDSMGRVAFELIDVKGVGADGAVVLGRWDLEGPNAGHGVFTVVLERIDGRWFVVHDHTSSDTIAP